MSQKRAVITGASSGIGAETARRLGRRGWDTVLVARDDAKLRRVVADVPNSQGISVDLTADDAPQRIATAIASCWGGLELLVNNAGAGNKARFGDGNGGWTNVERTMRLNFDAHVRLTEALRVEERAFAVHVGCVLPGFVATDGNPQDELLRSWSTRWLITDAGRVADAVIRVVEQQKTIAVVPWPWRFLLTAHAVAPALTTIAYRSAD